MKSSPLATIIIPTHNRRDLLEETIASVFNQSLSNWQCVVIDDASTDNTWEYLRSINDSRFDVLHFDKCQERSRSRNIGLERAVAENVLFLDDDDLLTDNSLQIHLDNIARDDGVFSSIGSSRLFWPDGSTRDWIATRANTVKDIVDELLFGWIPVSGQCLFKKEFVVAIGGWNESMSYAEDHHFMLRLASSAPAAVMSDLVHRYRFHGQWRPADMSEIMTGLREEFVAQLSAEKRRRGNRIMSARALRGPAEKAYEDARMARALGLYMQIAWLAPGLYMSPITRGDLLPAMLKSFLGGTFIKFLRAMKSGNK